MDAEDKKKLDHILQLTEENNMYIKKVRRSQKGAQIFKAVYWAIILLFTFGGFYLLKPYLTTIIDLYSGTNGGKDASSFQFSDVKNIQNLIDQYRGVQK